MTNSTTKLSPRAVNRGDVHVLRVSYRKVNSNTVVIILILFNATNYRLLYGNCSLSFSPRSEKISMTVKRSMKTCVC